MKAYTDLEQSKRLARILLLESADMRYGYIAPYDYSDRMYDGGYDEIPYPKDFLIKNPNFSANEYDAELPCWSLAALLEEIPDTIINMVGEGLKLHIDKDGFQYSLFYENEYTGNMFEIETELYDDMIDACYEMIIKLNEQKLL